MKDSSMSLNIAPTDLPIYCATRELNDFDRFNLESPPYQIFLTEYEWLNVDPAHLGKEYPGDTLTFVELPNGEGVLFRIKKIDIDMAMFDGDTPEISTVYELFCFSYDWLPVNPEDLGIEYPGDVPTTVTMDNGVEIVIIRIE